MALKKGKGANSITALQKRLMKLEELPGVLDRELQVIAMEMASTAINMAPIYSRALRDSIRYSRVGSQRNARGQFIKGGIGIHTVSFDVSKRHYFDRVLNQMTVGRNGGGKDVFQPSEHSVEVARQAGEIAGGRFMQRAFQKYEISIVQRLNEANRQFIKMTF